MNLEQLDDDQLDAHRREVLKEQERRQKLASGLDLIGQTVRDYCDAAGIAPPGGDDNQLGQLVIDNLERIEGAQ